MPRVIIELSPAPQGNVYASAGLTDGSKFTQVGLTVRHAVERLANATMIRTDGVTFATEPDPVETPRPSDDDEPSPVIRSAMIEALGSLGYIGWTQPEADAEAAEGIICRMLAAIGAEPVARAWVGNRTFGRYMRDE